MNRFAPILLVGVIAAACGEPTTDGGGGQRWCFGKVVAGGNLRATEWRGKTTLYRVRLQPLAPTRSLASGADLFTTECYSWFWR